jgi:MSHA pilin protein MshD
MNTGQMMITLGALALLSLVVLRMNNGFLNTSGILLDSKLGVLATSVATSIVEEATGKAFDEASVSNTVTSLASLSGPSSLKPESESYADFDDFDDYNGFHKIDNTMPAAEFSVDCDVYYVTDTDLEKKSTSRTWHKRIDVYVASESMYGHDEIPDTVVMSAVYSYWYFR